MAVNPMKYVCDYRYIDAGQTELAPAIQAVFPNISIAAAENNSAENPAIPFGRVRVTINMPWTSAADRQNSMELHGEIMQVPGVELYSGNIEA